MRGGGVRGGVWAAVVRGGVWGWAAVVSGGVWDWERDFGLESGIVVGGVEVVVGGMELGLAM